LNVATKIFATKLLRQERQELLKTLAVEKQQATNLGSTHSIKTVRWISNPNSGLLIFTAVS